MTHPVIHCFKMAVDYRTYRLANTSMKYDRSISEYILKRAKHMNMQMKPHTFNPFDKILTTRFLKNLKLNCNTDYVQEGAVMRLFHFIMNKMASTVLNARLSSESTDLKHSPRLVVNQGILPPTCRYLTYCGRIMRPMRSWRTLNPKSRASRSRQT